MRDFADSEWKRALCSLETAKRNARRDPDSAASRAYYAAFHALTALFALRGQTFTKHSAIRAALHRDLVKPGEWSADLGEAYQIVFDLREKGDYGGLMCVSRDEAKTAIDKAAKIIEAVKNPYPELEQGSSDSTKQE